VVLDISKAIVIRKEEDNVRFQGRSSSHTQRGSNDKGEKHVSEEEVFNCLSKQSGWGCMLN
jgi:hypothetical protein